MTDGYSVASFEDMEVAVAPDSARWATIRRHFGIEAFGVNAWRSTTAGQEVISEHDEVGGGAIGQEELYVVVSGKATFTVDGETVDAPSGTLVFVRDPAAKRKAVADEASTTILAVGAKAGEAFTSTNWELSAPAFPYFATKEYDKALEAMLEAHREAPDVPGVLYNLACAEAGVGRKQDALEHLRQAAEGREDLRELAKTDSDFDAIKDEPEFAEIVGEGSAD